LQAKPKILVLATVFPAFSQTFVVDHVMGLARSGWDVTVAAWKVDHALLATLDGKIGANLHVRALEKPVIPSHIRRISMVWRRLLPIYPRGLFAAWVRNLVVVAESVTELAGQIRPRVIHAHFGPNGISAAFAAKRYGIAMIVDFHGYDVTVVPEQHGWIPYRQLLSGAQAIVHSSFVEDRVRTHVGIPTHRIDYGVETSVFKPSAKDERWPDRIRLITVGRLVWQKGHHVALEALAELRHRREQRAFSLRICGDGPLREMLEATALKLGVVDAVDFTGALAHAEVAEQMAQADLLLVPSMPLANGWQEAFCRVAIEGMAVGLGVIATDTGGLAETVGEGGMVVRHSSAPELAAAVVSMLETSSPAAQARKARHRASRFPIEKMWQQYDAMTREAMRR